MMLRGRHFARLLPRRFTLFAACLGMAAAIFVLACSRNAPGQKTSSPRLKTLTILHVNDLHAHLRPDADGKGGFANVAAFIKKTKAARADVLVLDAGDMTQGSPVSTIYKGKPVFEILNAFGYDAAALGNHEFDYGPAMIHEYRAIARFPILCANIPMEETLVADAPTTVITVNGLKVGILGLTTGAFVNDRTLRFIEPEDAARRYLPDLRRKADVIVVLSHLGLPRDRQLAEAVKGIDVIVGGHTHIPLQGPQRVGQTFIVEGGCHGQYVGELRLVIDPESKQIVECQGRLVLIPVEGLAPDPDVKRLVDQWEGKVSGIMDIKIGVNPRRQEREEVKRDIEAIWKAAFQADFAIQNLSGTLAPLRQGDILIRDIYEIMPFDNTLVVLKMTRNQVAEEIEGATFDRDQPLYSVATSSFVADRLVRKYRLPPAQIERTNQPYRDSVIAFVKATGSLSPPGARGATPAAAGRAPSGLSPSPRR